jgi:lambda repressor-like predicted transcriptional regulator
VIDATAALATARAAWEAEIVQKVGVEGRSARQVSLAAGVSHQTINNILRRHGYE